MPVNKIQAARDFSINMMKAAVGLIGGKTQRLEASEKKRRLDICKACPSERFKADTMQCLECTCKGNFLELKASVNLWHCRLGHWDNITKATIEAPYGYCSSCKAIIETLDANMMGKCVNGHLRKIILK